MFLEKIEIQGFKSFAKKTILKFAHDQSRDIGLTVIVGPNGSGKSNIADAVRWVLGEQSVRMLRGKKSEDVIFGGSHKKSGLSFAEVSLYLNNESKKAPIAYTELVITRRLYRSGEGEYLINGQHVRLLDVQLLLAKARFGQRAYSVVGQGLVENFLNTTPSERKEFFDEATGVKEYQIKKHDAANKLNNAQGNLEQAEQLLAEIEPRLKSLTRQIKKLEQRAELETALGGWQTGYYAGLWHDLRGQLEAVNKHVVSHEEAQRNLSRQLEKFNRELQEREREQYDRDSQQRLESRQQELYRAHNAVSQELAEVRARQTVALEVAGKGDVAWLNKKIDELAREQETLAGEGARAQDAMTEANKQVVALRREQNALDERIVALRREIIGYHSGGAQDSDETVRKIRALVSELMALHDDIDAALATSGDLEMIKKYVAQLRAKVRALKTVAHAERARNDSDLEKINSAIITLEEEKQVVTERYIAVQTKAGAAQAGVNQLRERRSAVMAELAGLRAKLAQTAVGGAKPGGKDAARRERELTAQLATADKALAAVAGELKQLHAEAQTRRDAIIVLQKKTHRLQDDYNETGRALSEAQVEKARVETRLEDLENEVRRETGNLRAIMDAKDYKKIDAAAAPTEIARLKRQLELIGGIDPEVQKEYTETKERFEFLDTQARDLRAGIAALQKIITSLDKTITERFDRAFSDIATQFERYFKILFDGGSVRLEKIMDEESKIFTGIDVTACPPNKKIKNISSLSGGERALTSIALIAAIIAVNPSPFVLLDEVDAALDEQNSTRLAKILEDLSKKTQFIAITHNRTIMYKADIIYGVTMGDDGISKLLSVKVEDVGAARR